MSEIAHLSEYIYRYLDGDLSEVESAVLFNALSKDSALQHEFSEALAICSVALNEAKTTVIPAGLTAKVLQSADIGMVVAKNSSFGTLLSYAGVLILGFGLSFLMNGVNPDLQNASLSYHQESTNVTAGSGIQPSKPQPELLSRKISVLQQIPEGSVLSRVTTELLEASTSISEIAVSESKASETQPVISYVVSKEEVAVPIRSAKNMLLSSLGDPIDTSHDDLDFSIGLKRLTLLSSSGTSEVSAGKLNDLSISIMYKIDDRHFVGLDAGTEALPLYVHREDGSLAIRGSLRWVGLSYKRTEQLVETLPIQVFGTVMVGGAASGPLATLGFGLEYPLTNNLSINASAEGTQVMFQSNGVWSSLQRLRFTSGITINIPKP